MKPIGYRFIIKYDNGDTNEWFRETNIVSCLYETKELAEKAFNIYLNQTEDIIRKEFKDYVEFQQKFEKNVEEFKNKYAKYADSRVEEMRVLYKEKVSIIPEYLHVDTIDDETYEFNTAY